MPNATCRRCWRPLESSPDDLFCLVCRNTIRKSIVFRIVDRMDAADMRRIVWDYIEKDYWDCPDHVLLGKAAPIDLCEWHEDEEKREDKAHA